MKNFNYAIASVAAAVSCFAQSSSASAAAPSADAAALGVLAKSGSDLSKLHRVHFLLRFPTEDDAARAASQLEELAFSTETEHDETADKWVIQATKVMYPVESDLQGLRDKLNTIAAEGHGAYDGWQARLLSE